MPATTKKGPAPVECCLGQGRLPAKATRAFAGLFKALADETRLEIVGMLVARDKELCVCEIESHFDLRQPTVSHHLRILRDAGIVSSERRGTWVYYSLDRKILERLGTFVRLVEG